MNINNGMAIKVSRSTSQYIPLKLVIPAVNQFRGPPCTKKADVSCSKINPKRPAIAIVIIAEPGRAKATG